MKRLFALKIIMVLMTLSGRAQVNDIGITFTKRGHILHLDGQSVIAYFMEKGDATIEKFTTEKLSSITIDGKSAKKEQLRTGMEIVLTGDFFETTQSIEAHKITVATQTGKSINIEKGRLDLIKDGFAYTDGHRLKLAPKAKITGAKKSGYAGKSFNSFTELKLGDLINISGKYHEEGYILAHTITIEPETVSETQQFLEDTSPVAAFRRQYYDTWSNPATRHTMLGMRTPFGGVIAKDAGLQDYVSRIGHSLIPSHIKNKYKFMFIVVETEDIPQNLNAFMTPAGVSVINTTSLKFWFQNEAQLAAVLGHEIAHFIYEHTASREDVKKEMKEDVKKREEASRKRNDFINKVGPVVTVRNKSGGVLFQQKIGTKTFDILTKDLANARDVAKYSDYSRSNESQADRVGLTLMAQAGYDVSEAPLIWVKMIKLKAGWEREEKIRNAGKQAPDTPKTKAPDTKKYVSLNDMTSDIINTSLIKKAEKYHQKIGSHPDELVRVGDLNSLIAQYFSGPSHTSSAVTGEDRYITIINGFEKIQRAEQEKTIATIIANKKKRATLDKQFNASLPKQKQRLQNMTKPLLTYKGYTLRPVASITNYIKPTCHLEAITKEIAIIESYYQYFTDDLRLEERVKNFKDYKNEEDKDLEFAGMYAMASELNELAAKLATSTALCDIENVRKYGITGDDIKLIIDGYADRALKLYKTLNKKK